MRVLGVDPGLTRCGVGVVEGAAGRPLRLVAVDVIRTPPAADIAERLLLLAAELDAAGRASTGRTWSPSSGSSASTTCAP